jgi:hypothetical protein
VLTEVDAFVLVKGLLDVAQEHVMVQTREDVLVVSLLYVNQAYLLHVKGRHRSVLVLKKADVDLVQVQLQEWDALHLKVQVY